MGQEQNQGVQHGGGYSLQLRSVGPNHSSYSAGGRKEQERGLRDTEGGSDRTQPGRVGKRERGED